MYITKNFGLYELVPQAVYESLPKAKHHRIWGIFDDRTLRTADILRERYGSITINDWYWGGKNQYRGYRPPDCTVGADLSQHRFGRGLDLIFKDVLAEKVRADILETRTRYLGFEFITCLEMNITWLHFDTRNYDAKTNGILKIYP